MINKINLGKTHNPASLEVLPRLPEKVIISLNQQIHRCIIRPAVELNQEVHSGGLIAEGEHVSVHASISGRVTEVNKEQITISRDNFVPERKDYFKNRDRYKDYPRFLGGIGLLGMGGGMFPASLKLAVAKKISTLVVNCVECEPGISIDECLLRENDKFIRAGVQASAGAIGAKRIILALKKSARGLSRRLRRQYPYDLLFMNSAYPAGAERLILKRLTGRMFSSGILPFQLGYLIQNTTSLWAIGKAILEQLPVIERPLTLNIPAENVRRNLIVPVGIQVKEILDILGYQYQVKDQIIVAGGLMMGKVVSPDFSIQKGTNAVFLITPQVSRKEAKCIFCARCFDACPLGLHPGHMIASIKDKNILTPELRVQLEECFLCGGCSYVCPSGLEHITYIERGKQWIKE